mmetsp:Transcript_40894/g.76078  ORF Transcript_40894/g.76078 Transcript_40894/m.76078 type:complete len:261 (+) Transcript_40894:374-1156(+)
MIRLTTRRSCAASSVLQARALPASSLCEAVASALPATSVEPSLPETLSAVTVRSPRSFAFSARRASSSRSRASLPSVHLPSSLSAGGCDLQASSFDSASAAFVTAAATRCALARSMSSAELSARPADEAPNSGASAASAALAGSASPALPSAHALSAVLCVGDPAAAISTNLEADSLAGGLPSASSGASPGFQATTAERLRQRPADVNAVSSPILKRAGVEALRLASRPGGTTSASEGALELSELGETTLELADPSCSGR